MVENKRQVTDQLKAQSFTSPNSLESQSSVDNWLLFESFDCFSTFKGMPGMTVSDCSVDGS